jgi:hypothetical protein
VLKPSEEGFEPSSRKDLFNGKRKGASCLTLSYYINFSDIEHTQFHPPSVLWEGLWVEVGVRRLENIRGNMGKEKGGRKKVNRTSKKISIPDWRRSGRIRRKYERSKIIM